MLQVVLAYMVTSSKTKPQKDQSGPHRKIIKESNQAKINLYGILIFQVQMPTLKCLAVLVYENDEVASTVTSGLYLYT